MRALILTSHGGPEAVSFVNDLPVPSPGSGQVRVRVRAAALNHLDLWVRAGWPALRLEFPHVLGSDMAGEVDQVGAGVDSGWIGRRVLVVPGLQCGTCGFCLSGRDNLCRSFHLLGEHSSGGQAEWICVPERNVLPLPDGLPWEAAAALPVTFQTAWHMLTARAPVGPGDWLLVHAAGSGVGSAAVQIGKLFGASVIATARGPDKCQLARTLGADVTVDTTARDVLQVVKQVTNKRGVDVVFEHTGAATFDGSMRALRQGGKLVTCGATSGPQATIDLRFLFARQIDLLGSTMGTRAELQRILGLVSEGRLRPHIHRVLPLEAGKEAQALLESRQFFGKIVLSMGQGASA